MHATVEGTQTLNALLRGELAAIETYQQAIEKMANTPTAVELRRIHDEHRATANLLREHVRQAGGTPDQDSGAWGTWAKFVEGTAKLFGIQAAVKVLKEGEEHGVECYGAALEEGNLAAECQAIIRTAMGESREHIRALDRILQSKPE